MQSTMPSCLNALARGSSGASAPREGGAAASDNSRPSATRIDEAPSMLPSPPRQARRSIGGRSIGGWHHFASVNDPTSLEFPLGFPGARDGFRLFHPERQPLPR